MSEAKGSGGQDDINALQAQQERKRALDRAKKIVESFEELLGHHFYQMLIQQTEQDARLQELEKSEFLKDKERYAKWRVSSIRLKGMSEREHDDILEGIIKDKSEVFEFQEVLTAFRPEEVSQFTLYRDAGKVWHREIKTIFEGVVSASHEMREVIGILEATHRTEDQEELLYESRRYKDSIDQSGLLTSEGWSFLKPQEREFFLRQFKNFLVGCGVHVDQ